MAIKSPVPLMLVLCVLGMVYSQCTTRHCHTQTNSQVSSTEQRIQGLEKIIWNHVHQLQSTLRILGTKINEALTPAHTSCWALKQAGYHISGVYEIAVSRYIIQVYCDMDTDGGGWTVFQRRQDGSVDFNRNWSSYSMGFGSLLGEFWLGNNLIHQITHMENQELRVDMETFNGSCFYAKYSSFSIASETEQYTLTVSGYSGNATDSLGSHNRRGFTTFDRDNDPIIGNCALMFSGAWWFQTCYDSYLNGIWTNKATRPAIAWWGGPDTKRKKLVLNKSKMMMRPLLQN